MTQTVKEFLDRPDIKEIRERHTMGKVMSEDFFRDPFRSVYLDQDLFYAPADGFVLYVKEKVKPDDFLDIKGKDFSLKEMLADKDYKDESLVIGIFMSYLDVHVNRVPTSCHYLKVRETNQIVTRGYSMLAVENDLIDHAKYDVNDTEYLTRNEKQVSVFYSPTIDGRFYVTQVADKQVNVIINWRHGHFFVQGDRFGQIRGGSQCDLVLPIKKGLKYEPLVEPLQHVEAGIDPVLRVTKAKKDGSKMDA